MAKSREQKRDEAELRNFIHRSKPLDQRLEIALKRSGGRPTKEVIRLRKEQKELSNVS